MKAVRWLWSALCKRLKWYQAMIASGLIILLLVVLAMIGGGIMQNSRPALAKISEVTGLEFPSQTKLLASRLYSWQGQVLWARLELPRGKAAAFLKQKALLSGTRSHTDRLGVTDMKGIQPPAPSWWQPSAARRFVAVSRESNPVRAGRFRVVKVLVDLGGGKSLTGYVYAR
jgi:hypothetical protein